jgi:hypothetical protein
MDGSLFIVFVSYLIENYPNLERVLLGYQFNMIIVVEFLAYVLNRKVHFEQVIQAAILVRLVA